jgi:hypothetical protein
MLRCPPSRISLTNTDIIDFEVRHAARQYNRLATHGARANVRLSSGPGNPYTTLTITSEHDNVGRRRTASSSSHATICSIEDENDSTGLSTGNVPFVSTAELESPTIAEDVHHPLENDAERCQRLHFAPGSPVNHQAAIDHALRFTGGILDGCVDIRPKAVPPCQRDDSAALARRGVPILDDIRGDAYPISKALPSLPEVPPAIPNARRRRRYARSHDDSVDIHEDPPILQLYIQDRHLAIVPSDRRSRYPPVPELMLPEHRGLPEGAFNPEAPVFVPRTRFANSSSGGDSDSFEPRWNSLDSTHSLSNLRIRSASEQNRDPPPDERRSIQHRRPTRYHGELASMVRPSPNLDRYPVLRPPTEHVPRRTSGARRVSVQSQASAANVQRRPLPPGALQPLARNDERRIPSMVSAASGISGSISSHRTSSDGGLDAAMEFLRMRSSPLDDLTERISRVAASRPRSVGRSWERTPGRSRVSLLNGDPFRQEAIPPSQPVADTRPQTFASPPSTSSAIPPSTPPAEESSSSSRSPLAQKSPTKTPGSAVKRKPVPTTHAETTPRIAVYDDTRPQATQPQTPADVPSTRRSRGVGNFVRPTMPEHEHLVTSTPTQAHPRPIRDERRENSSENDVEAQLENIPELEEDRRTWLARQEDGSLETTPPPEGRFEKFLS